MKRAMKNHIYRNIKIWENIWYLFTSNKNNNNIERKKIISIIWNEVEKANSAFLLIFWIKKLVLSFSFYEFKLKFRWVEIKYRYKFNHFEKLLKIF